MTAIAEVGAERSVPIALKLRYSAWLLAVIFGFGALSWLGYAWCAYRTRNRRWVVASMIAFSGALGGLAVDLATKNAAPLAAAWLAMIVAGAISNHWYLARRFRQEGAVVGTPAHGAEWGGARPGRHAVGPEVVPTAVNNDDSPDARGSAHGDRPPATPAAPSTPTTRRQLARETKKAVAARRAELESAIRMATCSPNNPLDGDVLRRYVEEYRTLVKPRAVENLLAKSLQAAIRAAIRDEVLGVQEERWIELIMTSTGVDAAGVFKRHPDVRDDYLIARINDGRPHIMGACRMILKPGEVAYAEFGVQTIKEVVRREWRGRSKGVSVPIGFGVRYRTGSSRGRSVVVGKELVPDDSGVLTVTSARAVFSGQKRTLEFRHDRLVALEHFRDGLRLGVSNRQTATLFRFTNGSPEVAAAAISYGTSQLR